MTIQKFVAIWIASRQIEEIDSSENDEETTEQGNRVYRVGRVKPPEKDKGSAKSSGRKGDIVERVHTESFVRWSPCCRQPRNLHGG